MSLIKTLKNSFYFGVVPKLSVLINVILLPIITPYLTPYDYGIWGIISSYSGFIIALVPLGLNMHLSNSFFEYKKWRLVWGHILFLFLLSGFIGAVIFISIMMMELKDFSYGMRLLIGVCSSFPILLFGNNQLAIHLYPLLEKPKPLVFRNLAGSICSIAISFIVIYVLHLGFWGFVLGAMGNAVVTFVLFIPPLYFKESIRPTIDRNVKRIKNWLKTAAPVIPHTLGFILLSSSSRIIMSWYNVPIKDIGIFSNGYMIGDYITIVATSLATALSPQIQRAYRSGHFDNYRKLFYLCQFIVIGVVFCFSLWMSDIYRLLIHNSSFQEAIPVASYICYANALMPFYVFVSTICFIEKRTMRLLWLVFLPGALNVIICLAFIPIYGYKVAIYSTLIAFWSQLLVPYISKYHKSKIKVWFGSRWKLPMLLAALLSAVALSNVLIFTSFSVKIVITIIVLISVISLLKLKKWDKVVINMNVLS